jgi:ELWxxDGT repeat protein
MIGDTWIQSYAGVTSAGVYVSVVPTTAPFSKRWYSVEGGKAKIITTSEKSFKRPWFASAARYRLSGGGGVAAWGTGVSGGDQTGYPRSSAFAVWAFKGAKATRIAQSTSSADYVSPIGSSAGHAYWLQCVTSTTPQYCSLYHGTPTSGPAEVPNPAGITALFNSSLNVAPYDAFDVGAGTVLVPTTSGATGCELQLVFLRPSGSQLDTACAPYNPTWMGFIPFQGKIVGPGGLTYQNGAITRWIPANQAGTPIILTSQPVAAGSELFFFGHLEGSDQSNLYAWNGTVVRLVGQFEPSPLAFISGRPYLASIPGCDGAACEKNRTMNIYDLGVQPARKVVSATIGWENTYDIPSYPYCVACGPRMGFEGFKGKLYFSKYGSTGVEIYRWDPKTKSTTLFKNLRSGTKSSFPFEFKAVGSWMYFFADSNGRRGPELWATNGTTVTKLLEGP